MSRDNLKQKNLFTKITWLLTIATITVIIVGTELILRNSKLFINYYEKNGENSIGVTEILKVPWLWINSPNSQRVVEKKEYHQVFQFGPDGLVNAPLSVEKKKEECRLIFVGDSFIQGFGDTEGLGVTGRFESIINKNHNILTPYQIINAGIGGSDPVFAYELINRVLLKYKPNLILLFVNFTDIQDLMRRGGLDRFTSDGYLKKLAPWWVGLYSQSHLFRAFAKTILKYDENFIPVDEYQERENSAAEDIVKAIFKIHQALKQNQLDLLVMMHPLQQELEKGQLSPSLLKVKDSLIEKDVDVVDLTPAFLERIPADSVQEYYWKLDGHHNPKGYSTLASIVEAELRETPRNCTINFFVGNKN